MKKWHKRLAALLCGALLCGTLAGCGGQSGESGGSGGAAGNGTMEYGRYVEQDITPPDMLGEIRSVAAQGDVIDVISYDWVYDRVEETYSETLHRYRTEDGGGSWRELDMTWSEQYNQDFDADVLPDEYRSLGYGMAVLENGDLLAMLTTFNGEAVATDIEFLHVPLDGEVQSFRLPGMEAQLKAGKSVEVSTMALLPGDRLYLDMRVMEPGAMYYTGNEDVHVVCSLETGEQLYTLEWEGYSLSHNASHIFLHGYDGTVTAIDIETGKPASVPVPDALDISSLSSMSTMLFDEENNLYALDSRGVVKLPADGEMERLMNAESYSFGSPLTNASSFVRLDDGSFLVALSESNGDDTVGNALLLRYVYDPEAPASSDTLVRVYSVYESATVRLAISEFKKQHPEYGVEYEYAFETSEWGDTSPVGEGVTTEDDALKILATQLLSGNGPDVLILDDLPMDSYIEKGVLEDIADVVAGTDIMPAIVEPLKRDGKLYAVPASFAVPLVVGEADTLDAVKTLDGLLAAVEKDDSGITFAEPDENSTEEELEAYSALWSDFIEPEDRPVIGFASIDEAVDMLYKLNAPAVYAPGEGIKAEGVQAVLEQVKTLADRYKLRPLGYDNPTFSNGGISDGYILYTIPSLVEWAAEQKAQYGVGLFNSFRVLAQVESSAYWARYSYQFNDDGSFEQVENEGYVTPKPGAALLAGAAGSVYHPGTMAGVCTNSRQPEAARAFITCLLGEGVQSKDMANGFPVSQSGFAALYAAFAQPSVWAEANGVEPLRIDFDAIFAGLDTPAFTNTMIAESLNRHAARYCSGEVDLAGAVEAVLADSEIYFAEQQQ